MAHISIAALPSPWWRTPSSAGLPVTCEATPHHFALTDARHAPLRQQLQDEAAAALGSATWTPWSRASSAGAIDAIATDHAPHPGSEKMQEFESCPFGIIGLETAHRAGAGKPGAHRQDHAGTLVELFTTGPESVMRLDRGTLAPGAPAT